MSVPTLGDVVEVADTETVVRLDGTPGRLRELVLTGDVAGSLAAVLGAAGDPAGTGAGFFVVGPFGSGKSHFLAAVAELVADPAGSAREVAGAPGWSDELRTLAASARLSLAVPVPLVEYRARARLEDVVLERAWRALGRPGPAKGGDDRSDAWGGFLEAARDAGFDGVVLLLDELSELLRAKQGPALTEDLRFLQFLGEWTRKYPVVVVAALQESIEEVANVSQRELGRIRDRYRPSLTLSMRHVEDLVRDRLVRWKPGAEHWAAQSHRALCASYPVHPVGFERFARCYPLHPDTLRLLEGLRFLLSQQRGVVDFVCSSVRASLSRPCTELITPERVYDHFAGRLLERPETQRLAATVVGYYERALDELVDPEDRELALRVVKLLVLLAASPLERPRSAAELAGMLQVQVSDVDPAANAAYVEAAVLRPAAERGAYLVVHPGSPPTYAVDAGADAALVFASRVSEARAELNPADRRLVATLMELGSSPSLPLDTIAQLGPSRRELLWQNTLRCLVVGSARLAELSTDDARVLVAQARAAGAEGYLIVAEPELTDVEVAEAAVAARAAVGQESRLAIWLPAALSASEHAAVLDLHARRRVLDRAREVGLVELVEAGERAGEADTAVARELLRRIYFAGTVAYPPDAPGELFDAGGVDLPSLAGLAFERQLPRLADPLLGRLHPLHAQVAPRGELVGDRLLRRLVHEAIPLGRIPPSAMVQLRPLVDGYLVPLGLARSRRDGATVAPDPVRSPAVAELLRLVGEGDLTPAPDVVAALGDGPLGLSEPEAVILLNACVRAGLVEMLRGRKHMAEPFLAVTPSDRLAAGELVEPAVRDVVTRLGPIAGPGPFDPWTAATQRTAWQYAQAWLEAQREELAQVAGGLEAMEGIPALAGTDTTAMRSDAQIVAGVVEAAAGSASAVAGLRALAAAVDDPETLLRAARCTVRMARFFRDDLRRAADAAAFLTHPDLCLPDQHESLVALHDEAMRLLTDVVRLAGEDRSGDLFDAVRELRGAYVATYLDAHDRHYAAVGPAKIEAVRATPAYRALAALSAPGAAAVPDDQVKVDRALAAAAPAPCTRRVDQELTWRPICSCGLHLGDPLPVLDQAALVELARRGVAEHLAELAEPDRRARLAAAASDLRALGRPELAGDLEQLITLAAAGAADDAAAAAITGLLGEELRHTVAGVLAGSQLIVTRDLGVLREDLIGRRYPKRRLLELVAAWVDPTGDLPPAGFVEVLDSSDRSAGAPAAPVGSPGSPGAPAPSGTVALLRERFPTVADQLPQSQGADAFWLAAWWGDRPNPPPWLPAGLLADRRLLQEAAAAARGDPAALADLGDLDRRTEHGTVLGGQVAAALGLEHASAADVAKLLCGETLLRLPLRLGCRALLRRLAGDWQLLERGSGVDPTAIAAAHALVEEAELAALTFVLEAGRHLAEVERRLGEASAGELVDTVYAAHGAAVPALLSRADLAAASRSIVDPDAVAQVRAAAGRLLAQAEAAFSGAAEAGFPGCLPISDVGRSVVAPLLQAHGRVAVLLVDALRADIGIELAARLSHALPGRVVHKRWAVVPAPTRTAESLASLASGTAVPAGAAPPVGEGPAPFAHLGYETAVVLQADRDYQAKALRDLWVAGPPLSVAVATGIDERLHRTSVELAALLDDALATLQRRVLPSLASLPDQVPLVVLADHGFRENPTWGQGPEGRYVHGGTSLEECVVPVLVAAPAR